MWADSTGPPQVRSGVVGYAALGAICTQNSVSVCEEIGGFEYIEVGAHELGHSLGSYHDGDPAGPDVNCLAVNSNIMTATLGLYPTNLLNYWYFSNCSIATFKSIVLNGDYRYLIIS